jgi:hypothetical protein
MAVDKRAEEMQKGQRDTAEDRLMAAIWESEDHRTAEDARQESRGRELEFIRQLEEAMAVINASRMRAAVVKQETDRLRHETQVILERIERRAKQVA